MQMNFILKTNKSKIKQLKNLFNYVKLQDDDTINIFNFILLLFFTDLPQSM